MHNFRKMGSKVFASRINNIIDYDNEDDGNINNNTEQSLTMWFFPSL